MAQYDGSIRINTQINTKSAEVQLSTLENRIVKTSDKIAALQGRLKKLKADKSPTEEYAKLENQLLEVYNTIEKLEEKQKHLSDGLKDLSIEQLQEQAKSAWSEFDKVEEQLSSLDAVFSDIESKRNKLLEENPEGIFPDLDAEYDKTLVQYEKLQEESRRIQSRILEINEAIKFPQEIEKAKISAEQLEGKLKILEESGKAFTFGKPEEIAKTEQQLKYAENDLSVLNKQHEVLKLKLKKAKGGYTQLGNAVRQSFQKIGSIIKKTAITPFKLMGNVAKNAFSKITGNANKSGGALSKFGGRIKEIVMSFLIFNQIRKLFSSTVNSIKEGFTNLYNDNLKFKTSVDNLKASLLTMKNALASAFAPIVETAIPYIQRLVEWVTRAADAVGQLMAAFMGRKTYTRAIKQSAAASEDAAEATEEETEAVNKQLSPLDKLNVLTSENAKEKDKDSGAGSSIGTMFEEVPINNNILDMAEKVKGILSKLFAPLKEAWMREGKFVMDSWKYALDEVWKLVKDIGRDFLIVWNQEVTIKMFQDILHIIGDIGLIVGNLARNFRDAWNENQTGLHILENIRDIFAAIIHNIRLAADFTAEWAGKLNFSPLLQAFERYTESLIPVVDSLSGVLTDFYEKVLLPFAKWTLENGLPGLLDVFTAFNKNVDWAALRANLAEFWKHLEPFAETVGEGLIIFIEKISDLVADFLNSDTLVDFLHDLEDWMDNVTPEDVADAITKLVEALAGLKVALLAFKVGSSITKGLTALISNLETLAAIGVIATSVYVGIEFSKDYKKWKENIEEYGWYEGRRKTAEENPANPYRNGTAITQENGSGVFDKWLEKMKEKIKSFGEFIKDDWNNSYMGQIISSFTDGSWKEALSLWGEQLKADIKSVGEFIKDDWNNSYMGKMIASFTDGSWKEALELWGQDIRDAFSALGERISEKWEEIKSSISGKLLEIKDIISKKLSSIKEGWNHAWFTMKDKVSSIIQSVKSVIGSAVLWIKEKIQSLLNLFGQFQSAAKSMTSGGLGGAIGGGFKGGRSITYSLNPSVNAAMARLSEVEIPGYATGQVIPRTMKQHLAILGDNSRETEVVSPLSTIKQANKESLLETLSELGLTGGNGNQSINLNLTVECEGYRLLQLVKKLDGEYFKQTGRHAFA